MYGYIYLTRNLITGEVYCGKHKCASFRNYRGRQYLGLGRKIREAVEKYGKMNFEKELVCECDTKDELDNAEKFWIMYYKREYGDRCYNLAGGGDGGNVFMFADDERKNAFSQKMTGINKARCSSESFRKRISEATSARYADKAEREAHGKKMSAAWRAMPKDKQDEIVSRRTKKLLRAHEEYRANHGVDWNSKRCFLEFTNGCAVEFDSVREMQRFLTDIFGYTPDRRNLKYGVPFKAFFKRHESINGIIPYRF